MDSRIDKIKGKIAIKDKRKQIGVSLKPEHFNKLKGIAKHLGVPISRAASYIVEEFLDSEEIQ